MTRPWVALCLSVLCSTPSHAGTPRRETIEFVSTEEGRRILATDDEFVREMSPFDRAARLKTDLKVSQEKFLAFAGKAVLQWERSETSKVEAALQNIHPALIQLAPSLPERIYLVKTTGEEEANEAYTRGNAIVLPRRMLNSPERELQRLLAHELFHISSRANPRLRDLLYEGIGFSRCGNVEFPAALRQRKITNPDAPRNEHCIRIDVAGKTTWAMPILFSSSANYDIRRGGKFGVV